MLISSTTTQRPLKIIHDKRLAYLDSLSLSYKELGYSTKINGYDNLLEVYPKGYVIPKTERELIIEKWTN